MLGAPLFPFVTTRLLSYVAPNAVQNFYAAAEPAIAKALPSLQLASATLPAVATPLGIVVADVAFSAAVITQALALPLGLAGLAGLARAAARK